MNLMFGVLLIWISVTGVLSQFNCPDQDGWTPLTDDFAVSATYNVYITKIEPLCISQTTGNTGRLYPTGQSIENLIALIEKFENVIFNSTDSNYQQYIGAENMARALLQRFHFDGYDPNNHPSYQKSRDHNMDEINNAFLGRTDGGSGGTSGKCFPDKLFTIEERCSLYYMLSHNIFNVTNTPRKSFAPVFRGKRQSYNYNQNNRQQNNQGQSGYVTANYRPNQYRQYNDPVGSDYLRPFNRTNQHVIKEEGVVSFRSTKLEAIAPARVLIGVVAGLAEAKTQVKDVLKTLKPTVNPEQTYDTDIDPVTAMTLGDLWGSATRQDKDDTSVFFTVTGEWQPSSCTTHYGLTSLSAEQYQRSSNSIRATKAEIRGGIDGFAIGKNLQTIRNSLGDPRKLRLSTILRSYYSKSRNIKSTTLTANYCQRRSAIGQAEMARLNKDAASWQHIQTKAFGGKLQVELAGEFTGALTAAQQPDTSNSNDYCRPPVSIQDESAVCETPSDVIFIVDGQDNNKLQQSEEIVAQILGNLNNIRSAGGTVSIFFNSQGRNSVNPNILLPPGSSEWPLTAAAFNSTNTGCAVCRINDFNTSFPQPVANLGQYFKYLNQTLFDYEWWAPRTNESTVPAKSAILIDLGQPQPSVSAAPDNGKDRDDYNYFKDQLRSRHRDVKIISVSNTQDHFKDILADQDKDKYSPTGGQLGSSIAARICDNPATFQYNACNDRKSDNMLYVGYVTPGYKQNWAMYPEFFLKSFNIKFYFKAEEGEIRVCFDRSFPPKRQEVDYCKDIKAGAEEYFEINNPCKGRSLWSCDPFYFTVWGKERATGHCLDDRCMSLDQIRFTVRHSGVQCSSSNHLLPSIAFQFISMTIFAILYLFFSK